MVAVGELVRALAWLVSCLLTLTSTDGAPIIGSPIILVPGDGGSQIEAKLNKPSVVHYICANHTDDFFPIWVNLELLAPYIIDCFVDNMRLVYNPVTQQTSNPEGVVFRFPGWGDTGSIEYLDTSHISLTAYFATIVRSFIRSGYTRGKDIRGAPFDFRKAPNEGGEFFASLGQLIEDTYANNSNRRVVLLGHSMGNIMLLSFLQSKPQEWKDKYVQSYIAVSAPFGGSTIPLKLFASGYNLGERFVNPLTLRSMQRTFPSSTLLLPSDTAWSVNETLVSTPQRNYTVADMEAFFADIGFPVGWQMYQHTRLPPLDRHPGVPVYCVYGLGVPTDDYYVYRKDRFPDGQPASVLGDGDGTVNARSLEKCLEWNDSHYKRACLVSRKQAEHMAILSNPDVVSFVLDVARGLK